MEVSRDQNHVTARMGLLYTDGITPIPIAVNADGFVKCVCDLSITFDPATIAPRDENAVPVWMGQNSVTGEPSPIYVTEDGAILLDE